MKKNKWNSITRYHVEKAINKFLKENLSCPESRTTFLLYNGKKLPAKHIRGMAYKEAFGKEISKFNYSGGTETSKFFINLGFEILKKDENKKELKDVITIKEKKIESIKNISNLKNDKISISSERVSEQKNDFQLILNKLFSGDIVCEKGFDWLKTPIDLDSDFQKLVNELYLYRGDTKFARKNYKLCCDFVCESNKIIFEYDEKQHFSKAREISLKAYPDDIKLMYDKKLWIKACKDIDAKDNFPTDRDERRAYYDSVRDILAFRNGYKLVRIMHGQINFCDSKGYNEFKNMLIELKVFNVIK